MGPLSSLPFQSPSPGGRAGAFIEMINGWTKSGPGVSPGRDKPERFYLLVWAKVNTCAYLANPMDDGGFEPYCPGS